MEPAAINAETVRSRRRLTTLPRETRNHIYSYLVVSPKPIKVCYDQDLLLLYLRAGRHNKDISIEFLCHAVEGSELAQETYEEFFRNNVFDCGNCEDLRRFLTTTTTGFSFRANLFHNIMNHGYLKFEKNPWIRKVKISILTGVFEYNPSEQLAHLQKCPNLKQVEITIFGLNEEHSEPNPVDRTIEVIARRCRSIRGKVGVGLIVKVQKEWSRHKWAPVIINYPELEDVSWMWEEPSEEARERVRKGLGTQREKIQLLMSAGWAGQTGKVGAWAEHWHQEHLEQERPKKL